MNLGKKGLTALCLAVAIATSTSTRAADNGAVHVEQPWARASIGVSRPAAAYLTIVNPGTANRLIAVETPVAKRAAVHRTVREGEVMRMEPAGEVDIPAGDRTVFAPGGLHVMIMDLEQPLKEGGAFPLTLRFAQGAPVTVTVPILGPGARGPND